MATEQEVRETIIDIMENRLGVPDPESIEEKHFLDSGYDLMARHIIYLVLDLEKKYSIQFTEEELLDTGLLYSLDSLSRLVSDKCAG